MTLYDQILAILKLHQVQHIFGIPGDAINPLVDALRRDDEMRFIHVNHEEAGAFAASAGAKLSGRLGVCTGTVGPGAIHLLNGLYDAKKDRAPVLALLGQVPTPYLGSAYHQEVDLPALFGDVACFIAEIRTPEQMPQVAIEACNSALAQNGVAVLVIPHDIGSLDARDLPLNAFDPVLRGRLSAPQHSLAALREKVDGAKKITLFIGEGAREARELILPLAEHLQAPVIYSLRARDLVPGEHHLVAGGLGLLGTRGGVSAMKNCDLLIMLGSDFPYREWIEPDGELVQIDTRAEVLGRRHPGALGIHAETTGVMKWLMENVAARSDDGHVKQVKHMKDAWTKLMDHQSSPQRSEKTLHPQAVARCLSDLATDDAIFTCDTGEVTVWGARHLELRGTQRFSLSFNLASMAYALPAAIGAQLTWPDRQVISLSGDGGFNMLMGDFLTAVKYALPIKVIIFNNGKLGLIKMEQEAEGFPECETGLENPDYVALAKAMGGQGFRVERAADLEDLLRQALATKGPVIVDAVINPDEISWPPKIELSQAAGFGIAKIKELFTA